LARSVEQKKDNEAEEPRVEGLFFELSSESRFSILSALDARELKMAEIARAENLTAAEAFRQLQRMSESSLIQRKPEGSYAITEYGRLILRMSGSMESVFKHREYFLTHDLSGLPLQLSIRAPELARAGLTVDAMSSLDSVVRIASEAEDYLWACSTEKPGPQNLQGIVLEKIPKGVKFRFIVPERFVPSQAELRALPNAIEWRSFENVPMNLMLNEREANVGFRFLGGKPDFNAFESKDSIFLNWAKDLFSYFWERGKRPLPKIE